jgi:glycosyltransferase involved in cell wall biosynthesis
VSRIRVVYLAHTFKVGGAEEMVLNLVRHLPLERFEPYVCCIQEPGPIGEEIARTGTPVAALGLTPGVRHPFAVAGIRRYLQEAKPAIVHTFLLTASLYGRLAAILARVRVVVGTEVNIYEKKRRAHIWAERLLMSGTDCVIASAASVKTFYERQVHADPSKVTVIYNAVDFNQLRITVSRSELRRTLDIPGDAIVAGTIARLTEQKGHQYLIRALSETPGLEKLHLLLIGDGELRGDLERAVGERGLRERVHFLGARRDLGNLLGAIDLFVLPSLWEGLPLSLVLAMGAGLPVVSTTVAGVPEVVIDGETGLLVPPGDAASLGAAVLRLVTDRAEAEQIGRTGRMSVLPRFGIETYVNSIVGLYDRLLAESDASSGRRRSASGVGMEAQ